MVKKASQKTSNEHTGTDVKEVDLALEEYKLAIQIQENYHDLAYKTVTVYLAVTAISFGFVFRESVFVQLKQAFCWFNLAISFIFVICILGFYIISKRIAHRMDILSRKLLFSLKTHHALSYGILLTLLAGSGVFLFWIIAIVFKFWNFGIPKQTNSLAGPHSS